MAIEQKLKNNFFTEKIDEKNFTLPNPIFFDPFKRTFASLSQNSVIKDVRGAYQGVKRVLGHP